MMIEADEFGREEAGNCYGPRVREFTPARLHEILGKDLGRNVLIMLVFVKKMQAFTFAMLDRI